MIQKIDVTSAMTFSHGDYMYTVHSDVYTYDPEYNYHRDQLVLYKDKLYKAKVDTVGLHWENFEPVPPTGRVNRLANTDDLVPINEALEHLSTPEDPVDPDFGHNPEEPLEPEEPIDPEMENVGQAVKELNDRLTLVETAYVRTVNNETPLNGNINIDVDGSVMPPESTIVRWVDNSLRLPQSYPVQFVYNIQTKDSQEEVLVDGLALSQLSDSSGVQMQVGSKLCHTDVASLDTMTVNGVPVLTLENALDLASDQHVSGAKHFDKLYTTENPQSPYQVVNYEFLTKTLDDKINEVLKPQVTSHETFYVGTTSKPHPSEGESELLRCDGTKEFPFKTLADCVAAMRKADMGHNPCTIEFLGYYRDEGDLLELPDVGASILIHCPEHQQIHLPPLYVSAGKWTFENVIFNDNRLGQYPLEVDNAWVVLGNTKFNLNNPAPKTDAIFVHDKGTLQLEANATVIVENKSTTPVDCAISINSNSVMLCNQAKHANLGDANAVTVKNTEGSFVCALKVSDGSSVLCADKTAFNIGVGVIQYAVTKSTLYGASNFSGGVYGEKDQFSIVA